MLKVFYGENRAEAEKVIRQELGEDYEVFEGESLTPGDLPSIFQGATLFAAEKRRILLKNLTENTEVWAKIAEYTDTQHEVIVWEMKLDKRSAGYKALAEKKVELKDFAMPRDPNAGLVFGILDTAMRDGERAVQDLRRIEGVQDPFMFFGLLVTQALKKVEYRGGARERKMLKLLAETDMQMKSTQVEPWVLIESLLLRVGA